MISNSPDSYINVFHIHFHFQENISAETVILRTFQAFIGATTGVRSFRESHTVANRKSLHFDLHKTQRSSQLHLQKIVF